MDFVGVERGNPPGIGQTACWAVALPEACYPTRARAAFMAGCAVLGVGRDLRWRPSPATEYIDRVRTARKDGSLWAGAGEAAKEKPGSSCSSRGVT